MVTSITQASSWYVSGNAPGIPTVCPLTMPPTDTIHIGQTKIRLHGIDAPEMKQTCRTSEGKEQMCGVLSISFFVYSDRLCWLAMDIEHPP